MTIYTHKHHIVPVHAGGGNEPSNLIRITVEQHAQEHWELFCVHGRWEDELAWRFLSGQINTYEADQEARRQAQHARWAVPGAREAASKRYSGEGNPMWGKNISEDHKAAISKANSVPKPHVSINMKKLHAEGKSYTFNNEDYSKGGTAAQAGKPKWWTNGVDNKYVKSADPAPEGYRRGRTTGWKTRP